MTVPTELVEEALVTLNSLPDAGVKEFAAFLAALREKYEVRARADTPYKPIALGGIWKGIEISDDDVAEARRDMWGTFGKGEF